MRADRLLLGLHGAGVVLALCAALVWPRPGQAALMVPLAGGDVHKVLDWAAQENAALLALDSSSGRVVARITDNRSLIAALGQGIMPLAARAPGCRQEGGRQADERR